MLELGKSLFRACVSGELYDRSSSWDALRAALPVGTVSGAPKVNAMELIDELEATRHRPYGGGFGGISIFRGYGHSPGFKDHCFSNRRAS
ncbi:unnamed protein product [Cuscuta campestris]|uniref:Chorismate-utilising enzyme C-terminal domain-containing protein n=1 Tax=Cuscuta campestris TaxID=132261 RepID=A0A484MEH4_9ASTE|nr:unnamed protein product [Cuscuta campestris]